MQYDGSNFVKGIMESDSKFEQFKDRIADSDAVINGLDKISDRFSALGVIGATAIAKLTSGIMDFGEKIARSFAIDPIAAGLKEYETNINATRVILANTSSRYGTTLEEVTKALDELNVYADKTVYSFGQMTTAISKMTAAGNDLETSVSSIKGIYNIGAYLGAVPAQVESAVRQLGQSLQTGRLQYQDWRSVINADMSGPAMTDGLLDAAYALGEIDKALYTSVKTGVLPFNEAIRATGGGTPQLVISTKAMLHAFKGFSEDPAMTESATTIRTFTQLVDTTKESLGSGWSETFRWIKGDLNQATVLFSALGKAIVSILDPIADARNTMLRFWNENGGREASLKGLQNIAIALEKPIRTIVSAFRMVFSAIDGQKIVELSSAFEAFTKKLIPSNDTLQKIGDTFYMVFSVVKVVIDWIKALAGGALKLLGAFKPMLDLVGDLLGGLGAGIDIFDGNAKAIDLFAKAIELLAAGILMIATGIRNFMNGILGGLKTVMTGIGDIFRWVAGEVKNFCGLLGKGAGIIKNLFSSIGGAFAHIKTGGVSGFFQAFKDGFKSLTQADAKLKSIDDKMLQTKTWAERIYIAFTWVSEKLSNIWTGIGNFCRPMTDRIKELGRQFSEKFTADNILTFLLKFDWEGLLKGIGALLAGKGFGGLMESFKEFGNIGKAFSNLLNSIGNNTRQSNQDIKAFFEGLKAGLKEFTVGIKAGAVLKIAAALLVLVVAVSMLSKLDTGKMFSSIGGLGFIMGELAGVMKLMSSTLAGVSNKKLVGISASIAILAIAMNIMSAAVAPFLNASWEQMAIVGAAMGGLVAAMAGLAVIAKIIGGGDAKAMKKGAATMIVLSLAMSSLANTVKPFLQVNWKQLATAGTAMAGLIIVMAGMTGIMALLSKISDKGMLKAAVGLIVMSTAMAIVAKVVQPFMNAKWDQLTKAGTAMAGLIIVMAGMGVVVGMLGSLGAKAVVGVAAILGISTALLIMAASVKLLSSLSWDQLKIAGIAMAGLIVAVAALGALGMTPIGVGLIAVAGGIALLGVAILAMGVGIGVAVAGLVAFIGLGTGAGAAIILLGTAILSLIPKAVTALVNGIAQFVIEINEKMPIIATAVLNGVKNLLIVLRGLLPLVIRLGADIIIGLAEAIADNIQPLVDAGMKLVLGVFRGIADNIKLVVEAAIDIVTEFLYGIASRIDDVIDSAVAVITAFIDGIAANIGEIIDSAVNLLLSFLQGIADAIQKHSQRFVDVAGDIAFALSEAIVTAFVSIDDIGRRILDGLVSGLLKGGSMAKSAGKALGKMLGTGTEEELEIKSPSKRFMRIGKLCGDGLLLATKKTGNIFKSGAQMGDALIRGIRSKDGLDMHSPPKRIYDMGAHIAKAFDIIGGKVAPKAEEIGGKLGQNLGTGIEKGVKKETQKKTKSSVYKAGAELGKAMTDGMITEWKKNEKFVAAAALQLGQVAVDAMKLSFSNSDDAATQFMHRYGIIGQEIDKMAKEMNEARAKEFARNRLIEEAKAYDDGIKQAQDNVLEAEKKLEEARTKAREEANKEAIKEETKTAAQVAQEEVVIAEQELKKAIEASKVAKTVKTASVDEVIKGIEGVVPGVSDVTKEEALNFAFDFQDQMESQIKTTEEDLQKAMEGTLIGALTGFGGEGMFDLSFLGAQFSDAFIQGFVDGTKGSVAGMGDVIANSLDKISDIWVDAGVSASEDLLATVTNAFQLDAAGPFRSTGIKMGGEVTKGFLKGLSKGTRAIFDWFDKITRHFGDQMLSAAEDVLGKFSDMTVDFGSMGIDFGADVVNWITEGATGEFPSIGNLIGSLIGGSSGFLDIGASAADAIMTALLTALGVPWLAPFAKIATNLGVSMGKAFISGFSKIAPGLYDLLSRSVFKLLPLSWQEWITDTQEKIRKLVQSIFGTSESEAANAGDAELKWIRAHGKQIGVVYLDALEGMQDETDKEKENLTSGITKWIGEIAEALRAFGPVGESFAKILDRISGGLETVGGLLQTIWARFANPFQKMSEILKGGLDTNWFNSFVLWVTKVWESMSESVTGAWYDFWSLGSHIRDAVFDGMTANSYSGGASVVGSIFAGLSNATSSLWNNIKELGKTIGNAMLTGIKDFLGIHSPSTEGYDLMGWFVKGLAQGAYDKTCELDRAMTEIGDAMMNAIHYALETENDFVITPVLDLTDISAGSRDVRDILNGSNAKTHFSAHSVKLAHAIANRMDAQDGLPGVSGGNVTNVEFKQYNTSPKALTAVDIYRRTDSQIAILKRRVGMS
jgi:hypothetical protein